MNRSFRHTLAPLGFSAIAGWAALISVLACALFAMRPQPPIGLTGAFLVCGAVLTGIFLGCFAFLAVPAYFFLFPRFPKLLRWQWGMFGAALFALGFSACMGFEGSDSWVAAVLAVPSGFASLYAFPVGHHLQNAH